MKIALATVHCNPQYLPLTLLYLKAWLVERCGFDPDDVSVLEFDPKSPAEEVAETILSTRPALVGLSCYVWNVEKILLAARRIKEAHPAATVVLGGPEVGPRSTEVMERSPFVDAVVRGEGEIPFGEIATALRSGAPMGGIRGITVRTEGRIAENGDAPLLQDLGLLPSPHHPRYGDYSGRWICIETQRGCAYRCGFCYYNKDYSIRNRRFDLERVKQELLYWLRQDVAEIYLMDPIFNLDGPRAKEICGFIAANNPRRIPIHTEIWAEFVDGEMARLFREAGFHRLEVGLQTSNERVLEQLGRPLDPGRFACGFRLLKEQSLHVELHLILGLPGESLDSFRRSLDFAVSLDPPSLAVFDLHVLPGTDLHRRAASLALEHDPDPPHKIRSTPLLPEGDLRKAQLLVSHVLVLRRSVAIRLLCRESRLSLTGWIEEFLGSGGQDPDDPSRRPGTREWALRLRRFLHDSCVLRGTDPAFYDRLIGLEFHRLLHGTGSGSGVQGAPSPGSSPMVPSGGG